MAAGDSLRYHNRSAVPAGRPETYGSRTMTIHPEELDEENGQVSPGEGNNSSSRPVGTLKLRGGGQSNNRKVKWDDGVVDNEGLGRKKSKICCIYHKPRAFDESSGEESSSCDSDNSDNDHSHKHEGANGHNRHHHNKRFDKQHRNNNLNAYERQPYYKNRPRPPTPPNSSSPEPEDNATSPSS